MQKIPSSSANCTRAGKAAPIAFQRHVVVHAVARVLLLLAMPIGPRTMCGASEQRKIIARLDRVRLRQLGSECNRCVVEAAVRFVYGTDDRQAKVGQIRFGRLLKRRLTGGVRAMQATKFSGSI